MTIAFDSWRPSIAVSPYPNQWITPIARSQPPQLLLAAPDLLDGDVPQQQLQLVVGGAHLEDTAVLSGAWTNVDSKVCRTCLESNGGRSGVSAQNSVIAYYCVEAGRPARPLVAISLHLRLHRD